MNTQRHPRHKKMPKHCPQKLERGCERAKAATLSHQVFYTKQNARTPSADNQKEVLQEYTQQARFSRLSIHRKMLKHYRRKQERSLCRDQ
jgi:hypothetical protein